MIDDGATYQTSSGKLLIIVPCGRAKIWDRDPDAGPMPAREAYSGYPFRVNAAYAERFGASWLILSAKYGLIEPCFEIPGPYDVSFNRPTSGPISHDRLREQARHLQLGGVAQIVGLGGRAYRDAVTATFAGTGATVIFPFARLPLGRMIRATRRAIERGDSGLGD